jgi:hypothetical protein
MSKETQAANRARMGRLVEEWRGSGESAAAFARRHGIGAFKFLYWRNTLGPRNGSARKRSSAETAFAPVRLLNESSDAPVLEIRLANGDAIRCGGDIPVARLSALVRILRERC